MVEREREFLCVCKEEDKILTPYFENLEVFLLLMPFMSTFAQELSYLGKLGMILIWFETTLTQIRANHVIVSIICHVEIVVHFAPMVVSLDP